MSVCDAIRANARDRYLRDVSTWRLHTDAPLEPPGMAIVSPGLESSSFTLESRPCRLLSGTLRLD